MSVLEATNSYCQCPPFKKMLLRTGYDNYHAEYQLGSSPYSSFITDRIAITTGDFISKIRSKIFTVEAISCKGYRFISCSDEGGTTREEEKVYPA